MNNFSRAQMYYLQLLVDAGCKIRFRTELFGKEYAWLTAPEGTYFLEPLPPEEEAA